ncbi:MAG: hypothetical protein LBH47_01710 [Christensenellaceae bacterium]|jgi:hypothetical protein|nr:hypothetical protein [Christensenellaceae bacterium]
MKKTKFVALMAACFVSVAAIVGGSIWWMSMSNKGSSASSPFDAAQWNEIIKNMKVGKVYKLWGLNFLCVAEGDNDFTPNNNKNYEAESAAHRNKIKTFWLDGSSMANGRELDDKFIDDSPETASVKPDTAIPANRYDFVATWSHDVSSYGVYNQNTYLHSIFNKGAPDFYENGGTDTNRTNAMNAIASSVYEMFKNGVYGKITQDPTLFSFVSPGFKSTINSAANAIDNTNILGATLYADDYFWAPSYREVEDDGTWDTASDDIDFNDTLRAWNSGGGYTRIGRAGLQGGVETEGTREYSLWLRSPSATGASYATNGGVLHPSLGAHYATAVRPAVHLSYSNQPLISPNQIQEDLTFHQGAMVLIDGITQNNVISLYRAEAGITVTNTDLTYYAVTTVATRLDSITEDMKFTQTIPTATFASLEEATFEDRYVYVKIGFYVYEVKIIILPADISLVSA